MTFNKALGIVVLCIAAVSGASAGGADPPAPPALEATDQRFLTRLVRRTIQQFIIDESLYETTYVPPSLRDIQCPAVVTLRQSGIARGMGTGPRAPVVQACRDAAVAALADAAKNGPVSLTWLERVLIDIELVGESVAVPFNGSWTDEFAFNELFEPGVDGVVLEYQQYRKEFCPTQIVHRNISVFDAIGGLAQQVAQTPKELEAAELSKFRTTHWHELAPDGEVIELRRGLRLVPVQAVTRQSLAGAIHRVAAYMVYRQLPSGMFSYQYEPSTDVYTSDDNLVRQAGAAWALALHARWFGHSASAAASTKAIGYLAERMVDLPGVPDAAFIAGRDDRHKLGISALTALAMFDHPEGGVWSEARNKLVNAVQWLQAPSGMFITAFPPSHEFSSQYYFPGEALLLIARAYEDQPGQKAVESFERGYEYYTELFRNEPTPPFVPWHTQAFSRMAARTKRGDYRDFVFEMTDWLVEMQYTPANCRWPELVGGVEAHVASRVGVATASYLEGFVEALELARAVGDKQRQAKYEQAVRLAARFVMQLEFRPEEAYYVQSLTDTLGGIRTSPTNNLLRIDHCQHALVALMKTQRALFPEGD